MLWVVHRCGHGLEPRGIQSNVIGVVCFYSSPWITYFTGRCAIWSLCREVVEGVTAGESWADWAIEEENVGGEGVTGAW